MSENETQQPTSEPTPVSSVETAVAPATKKSSLKSYLISILAVAVVILGVLFLLEKEGRSSTQFFTTYLANQEANKVVAVVNGEEIINKELDASIEQFSQMAVAQGVDITTEETKSEIRTQSLEVLVNTQLLKQQASERGLSISDETASARIEEIKVELGGEEVLNERMLSLGITAEELHEDVKDELLIQSLLDEIFAEANIDVTEEEILAVYQQAGGADAGLPELEEVTAQITAQLKSSKEQEAIDNYLAELKSDAEIEIVE